jgi:hypothetical protein
MPTSKKQVLAISGMGVYGKVANYSALPAPALHDGETWICLASQGTFWLPGSLGGTFYDKGYYYSNGTTWTYNSSPYQATQSDVNTGVIDDQFVSPNTLANSTWAFTVAKVLATALSGLSVTSGGVILATDTILQAFGKIQYQITNLNTIYQTILVSGTNIKTITGNSIVGAGDLVVIMPTANASLAGTGSRIVEASTTGVPSASKELVSGFLSVGATATLLTNTANWNVLGVYTGTAITGTFQGQMYSDSNYFFIAVADNLWIRLIRG